WLHAHCEMSSSSIAADPSPPQISTLRDQPGHTAVLASIEPIAPFGKRSTAQQVSSDSMLVCTTRVVQANTSDGSPANHCNRSTAWMAWLISAPPPSSASLPFHPV